MSSPTCTAHGQQKVSINMGQHLATPRSFRCPRRERTSRDAPANHHLECTHTLPRLTARRRKALLMSELSKLSCKHAAKPIDYRGNLYQTFRPPTIGLDCDLYPRSRTTPSFVQCNTTSVAWCVYTVVELICNVSESGALDPRNCKGLDMHAPWVTERKVDGQSSWKYRWYQSRSN